MPLRSVDGVFITLTITADQCMFKREEEEILKSLKESDSLACADSLGAYHCCCETPQRSRRSVTHRHGNLGLILEAGCISRRVLHNARHDR